MDILNFPNYHRTPMKAIVLAAGRGTRLLPLTDNRPKHLLEVGGKSILKWQLDELLSLPTIEQVIIVVNYQAELIKEAVNSWYDNHRIVFITQKEALGTGDAVNTGLELINSEECFMVINGDVLLDGSIKMIVKSGFSSAILGSRVDKPQLFGVLEQEKDKLLSIIEKPSHVSASSIINAGLYIFPRDAISMFRGLAFSPRGEKELTDVIAKLIEVGIDIHVLQHQGKWFDIGHPWQILDANEYLLEKYQKDFKILGEVETGATLIGSVHVALNARVRAGVYIEGPVYIDEGADIGPNCYIRSRSYLGKNVRVGNACEIKNCVIYKNTHAAHLSYIGDSVLGEYSNLGAGTITANLRHDGKNIRLSIKDERVDTGRRKLGIIMGDHVKTGIGVSFLPGVKISGNKWIDADELVTRDINQ